MRVLSGKRYLSFAVRRDAPIRHVRLLAAGSPVRGFDVGLAAQDPEFRVYTDISGIASRALSIDVDGAAPDPELATAIAATEDVPDATSHYQEALRPLVHFSTRRGWSNDPNGLVYFDREYHLFYQHNPFGCGWGTMHWGHAVSTDLIHWQELGEALHPDDMGQMWSGSGVVDANNTSGLGRNDQPPLVLFYTAAGGRTPESEGRPFTQCLAYSNDRGRTINKLTTNPVLGHVVGENRDPKVVWDAARRQWVMALYLEGNRYGLFGSIDLKHWEHLSDFELAGAAECPDIFTLPVGERGEAHWVFWGANGTYAVGEFDGRDFRPQSDVLRLSWGDAYAAQTWFGAPVRGCRRQIAWLRGDIPEMPFNQMMTFPVDLRLVDQGSGPRLSATFVPEIDNLHRRAYRWRNLTAEALAGALNSITVRALHIRAEIEVGAAGAFQLLANGVPIEYSAANGEMRAGETAMPVQPIAGVLSFEMLIDRTSAEVVADGGCAYLAISAVPSAGAAPLAAVAPWRARVRRMDVHELASIWQ